MRPVLVDIRSGIYFCIQLRASVSWIISVNNFYFFSYISDTMFPTNICYISSEISSFYSASVHFCCIKIHAEMAEKSQVKDRDFNINW